MFNPIPGNNSSYLTVSPRIQDRWGSFCHRKSHRHGGRGPGSIPSQWAIHCYHFRGHPWGRGETQTSKVQPNVYCSFVLKRHRLPRHSSTERCGPELRPAFPEAGSLPGHQEKGTADRRCALSGTGQLLSAPELTPKTERYPLDKGEDSGARWGPPCRLCRVSSLTRAWWAGTFLQRERVTTKPTILTAWPLRSLLSHSCPHAQRPPGGQGPGLSHPTRRPQEPGYVARLPSDHTPAGPHADRQVITRAGAG